MRQVIAVKVKIRGVIEVSARIRMGALIDMLCPQHGAIYQGADVARFINWFSERETGFPTFKA